MWNIFFYANTFVKFFRTLWSFLFTGIFLIHFNLRKKNELNLACSLCCWFQKKSGIFTLETQFVLIPDVFVCFCVTTAVFQIPQNNSQIVYSFYITKPLSFNQAKLFRASQVIGCCCLGGKTAGKDYLQLINL